MLINPVAIVAFLLYLIAGPLSISQRFQTCFRSLGHGVHQKISSVLSLPHAPEPQEHPVILEVTTLEPLPVAPVEVNAVHPVETLPSCAVPLEDHVEAVIPEVCPTGYDDHPAPTPVRVFVVTSEYRGPFDWRNLFTYQVIGVLTAIYVSIWLPFVVVPFVSKLRSRSESLEETKQPVDTPPEPLPPKVLAPPPTVHIWFPGLKSYAPLEPIFSPAPSEPSDFWLAPEQIRQDQPSSSPPFPHLLDLPTLENESERQLSPLSSPADSGYGTTLPDAALDASSLEQSVATNPEHTVEPLPTTGVESPFMHGFENATTTEEIGTAGSDTETEDDDDGSTTVTNSIANLADSVPCPVPVPAEELAARLKSVTDTSVDKVKAAPEPPVEEPSVTTPPSDDMFVDAPSHDGPAMDLLSGGEPISDLGTVTQESAAEEIPVDVCPSSEPSPDTTDAIVGLAYVDEKTAYTSLETVVEEDETPVEDLPSQDDSEQDVGPWIPDYKVPTIVITPPSEVDPEDIAQQLDSEQEQEESEDIVGTDFEDELEPEFEHEESEYDDGCDLGYADYPARPVVDAYHSPITTTGMLWSDDEGGDLGPLPFTEGIPHVEEIDDLEADALEPSEAVGIAEQSETADVPEHNGVQEFAIEGEMLETVATTSEDSNVEEPVAEAVQELIEEPQPAPEAPAQKIVEPAPAVPVPSPNPSPCLKNPPHASRSYPIRTQESSNNEDRGEGSSQNGRTVESPRLQYYHCCKLYRSDGRPDSWENWKFEKPEACIPTKTHLQMWQFVRPTDKDGQNPTTRIAIDNLDADWFRVVEGTPSYNYLTEAMKYFSTKYFRCWRGRTIDGVEYSSIGYATVDFDSVDEAIRMFDELQGKRLRGHTWHWRLEFVDPKDDTHGGRKVIRTDLVPDSVKQALAAELEASTRRHGRSCSSGDTKTDTSVATRPPARVRPQLSIGSRSLFSGAMANVVQDRHTEEQPVQPTTRVPHRRPYRS